MNEKKDQLVVPRPDQEESEMFRLFAKSQGWKGLEEYLQRCLDFVILDLGQTENPRDHDMVLKGAKAILEQIIELPKVAEVILNPEKKEEVPDEIH